MDKCSSCGGENGDHKGGCAGGVSFIRIPVMPFSMQVFTWDDGSGPVSRAYVMLEPQDIDTCQATDLKIGEGFRGISEAERVAALMNAAYFRGVADACLAQAENVTFNSFVPERSTAGPPCADDASPAPAPHPGL